MPISTAVTTGCACGTCSTCTNPTSCMAGPTGATGATGATGETGPTGDATQEILTTLTNNLDYSGLWAAFVPFGDAGAGDVVYLEGNESAAADASTPPKYPAVGVVVHSAVLEQKVLLFGTMRNDAWAWTPGGVMYLGEVPGEMTQTPPATVVQVIGIAILANVVFFNPDLTYTGP